MAGGTISHAKLKVSSSGTQGVAKQLDQVGKATVGIGRAQTRLGQASASAGRQFSAQANGLGGLVAAYAGAAANIFAITAAFAALKKSAEFEQIVSGTNRLAASVGESGDSIIKKVDQITKSQLSLLDVAQQVNLGLASGFNSTQIENLSNVSLRASKALGRNLADAFTRVVRGAAKLEPELLDELGIFTRIDPAVRKYADALGKSVSNLTNFERRQAFVNAVIEEGTNKFRDVDTTTQTAAESLQKLAVSVIDLGLKFGVALSNGIAPFADFLSGNLSNTMAVFGLLLNTIGKGAVTIFSAGIAKATASMEAFGASTAARLSQVSKGFRDARDSVAVYAAETNLPRLGNLQLREEAANALKAAANKKLLTKAEIENAKAKITLYRQTIQNNIALGRYTRNSAAAALAVDDLTNVENKLTVVAGKTGRSSNFLSGSFSFLGKTVGILGRGLSTIISKLFLFGTVLSFAQLGLDALGKVFGFQVNILEGIVNILKNVIASFKGVGDTVNAFISPINDELLRAANSAGVFGDAATKAVKGQKEDFERLIELTVQYNKVAANFINSPAIAGAINPTAALNSLPQIQNVKKDLDAVTKSLSDDPIGRLLLDRLKEIGRGDIIQGAKLIFTFDEIAKATGIAANKFYDLVTASTLFADSARLSLDSSNQLVVTIGKISTVITESVKGITTLKKEFKDTGPILTAFVEKAEQFNKDFQSGTLNAERAAAAVGAQLSLITRLEQERQQIAIGNTTIAESERQATLDTLDTKIKEAKIEATINQSRASGLTALEKQNKLLKQIFGIPQEKIDKLTFQGTLGSGGFARSSREAEANQAQKLVTLVEKGAKIQQSLGPIGRERFKLVGKIAALEEKLAGETGDTQRELSRQKVELADRLLVIDEQIKKVNSAALEDIKASETAQKQLFLLSQKRLKILDEVKSQENEVLNLRLQSFKLEQQNLKLQDQLTQAQNKRAIESAKTQIEAQKSFRESVGTLTTTEGVGFDLATGRLTIAAAAEDKNFAKAQAERDSKSKLKEIETRENIFKRESEIRKINFEATMKLIGALEKNTLANINQIRKGQGLQPLVSDPNQDLLGLKARMAFDSIGKLSKENFAQQRENVKKEAELKTFNADASFEKLKESLDSELALKIFNADETVKLFKSVSDILGNEVRDGINGLVDSLIEGTLTLDTAKEAFRQFFFNILKGVQEAVLEQTLIKPLTNAITNNLGSMFGLEDIAGQSMEQAAAVTTQAAAATASTTIAASLTTVGTSLTASSTTLATQVAAAIIPAQTALTTVGTQISLAINAMATQLQIAATTAQARIAAAVATATASSAIPIFAAGGKVKHFAGGGSNQLRDRVAAMLEPGEFVVRKEAAKMIGLSKLQQMNSGNADIFKMLGMNPVKKAGGGPAGSAGMSGSGDHSGTSAAGPSSGVGGGDSFGFGFHDMAASDPGVVGGMIGSGGGSGFADISQMVKAAAIPNYVGAQNMIAKGYNPFADSTQSALALSSIGKSMGMVGDIDPRKARDIEKKMDIAKQSARLGLNKEFDVKQAYTKANTGVVGNLVNALAPKTPMDLFGLIAGTGKFGAVAKGLTGMYSGMKAGIKGKSMLEEIDRRGLKDTLDSYENQRMQQNAAGGAIRHMAGGGSVNTRDRVPALLEPGEFVIRRPMAKAIGGQALNQMNSTGRPPQISVNLNNSGAPKSVDVQPPRVNGDKIILDIITRDMRNNGSMRKALRRGK